MPSMLAHTCNPSTLEAEGGPGIQGHIALQCKTLPPTTNFFFLRLFMSPTKKALELLLFITSYGNCGIQSNQRAVLVFHAAQIKGSGKCCTAKLPSPAQSVLKQGLTMKTRMSSNTRFSCISLGLQAYVISVNSLKVILRWENSTSNA